MGKRGNHRNKKQSQEPAGPPPNDNFRVFADSILKKFQADVNERTYTFTIPLTKELRKYIHMKALRMGLKSKSTGVEPNRVITIQKRIGNRNSDELIPIEINAELEAKLTELQNRLKDQPNLNGCDNKRMKVAHRNETMGRMFMGSLIPVDLPKPSRLEEFRRNLPIFKQRQAILDTVERHQLTIITAETGSGKTTQIPQYILEETARRNGRVRIICTQPRRLSTVSVAARVASERGERLGETVGYQIKLESVIGAKTSLIYCTNGILLRTLMGGTDCLNNVTHIIVDEIHERDKFTDFLMIILRKTLHTYPHLRVVLMSATMDVDIFSNYFIDPQIMFIEGRSYPITTWFLEDILSRLNYSNDTMVNYKQYYNTVNAPASATDAKKHKAIDITDELRDDLQVALQNCFDKGTESDFCNVLQLLLNEMGDANFQDADGHTALMAAAVHDNLTYVEQLLSLGADPLLRCNQGWTAADYAKEYENFDLANALNIYKNCTTNDDEEIMCYENTWDETRIDFDLILALIRYIRQHMDDQAGILIFLPGYDDIMRCSQAIQESELQRTNVTVFMLHSSMQMGSQHSVFNKLPGKQKIILSTNIAETSITIDGIRFVIDSGRAKQKSFNALSGASSLETEWISMASARQRAGRAGRTQDGYCFHLFSLKRYETFLVHTIPEMLRVALDELCLQTKMLAPKETSICEFLQSAVEPPTKLSIETAIQSLKALGALDEQEDLTLLGTHLLQFSIAPHLAKILLYGAIFKCLDPVLTLVATMTHKDPFNLPMWVEDKREALKLRHKFSNEMFSDHFAFINVYKEWQKAKVQRRTQQFCKNNYISPATMELIMRTRTQLLSQLRSIGFISSAKYGKANDMTAYSHSWPLVKACISSGIYPKVAFYKGRSKLQTQNASGVVFSRNTSFAQKDVEQGALRNCWTLYDEISTRWNKHNIAGLTLVNPLTISLFVGNSCEFENEQLTIDNTLNFEFSDQLFLYRQQISAIIDRKIRNPHYVLNEVENYIIHATTEILQMADENYTLPTACNIGEVPILLQPHDTFNVQDSPPMMESSATNGMVNPQFRRNRNEEMNGCGSGMQQNGRSWQQRQRNMPQGRGEWQRNPSAWDQNAREWYPHGRVWQQNRDMQANSSGEWNQQNARNFQPNSYQNSNMQANAISEWNQNSRDWQAYDTNRHQNRREMPIESCKDYSDLFPYHNVDYFMIRPCTDDNIEISITQGTWVFSPTTEKKILAAFMEKKTVLLIYATRNSNRFYGCAKVIDTFKIGAKSKRCKIEWCTSNQMNFSQFQHLGNFKVLVDGDKFQPNIGQAICSMLYKPTHSQSHRPIVRRQNQFFLVIMLFISLLKSEIMGT